MPRLLVLLPWGRRLRLRAIRRFGGCADRGTTLEPVHAEAIEGPRASLTFSGEPGSFVEFAVGWGDMSAAAHGTFGSFNAGAASPVADSVHVTACAVGTKCLFYFHSSAAFDFEPVCE